MRRPRIPITYHAIVRWRERVEHEGVSFVEARRRLQTALLTSTPLSSRDVSRLVGDGRAAAKRRRSRRRDGYLLGGGAILVVSDGVLKTVFRAAPGWPERIQMSPVSEDLAEIALAEALWAALLRASEQSLAPSPWRGRFRTLEVA